MSHTSVVVPGLKRKVRGPQRCARSVPATLRDQELVEKGSGRGHGTILKVAGLLLWKGIFYHSSSSIVKKNTMHGT